MHHVNLLKFQLLPIYHILIMKKRGQCEGFQFVKKKGMNTGYLKIKVMCPII